MPEARDLITEKKIIVTVGEIVFFYSPSSKLSRCCGCITLFSIEASVGGKIGPSAFSMMDFSFYDC